MKTSHIKNIVVKRLFGHVDYNLSANSSELGRDDLIIFYGDNGSGKTTILKMIFNLLSKQGSRGHKTFLSRLPFAYFLIEFEDNSSIEVKKRAQHLTGSYQIIITDSINKREAFNIKTKPDGSVGPEDNPFIELHASINRLGVSLYFLPDDRKVQSDFADLQSDEYKLFQYNQRANTNRLMDGFIADRDIAQNSLLAWTRKESPSSDAHYLQISPIFEELTRWIQRQTIQNANMGEENASSIYLRVVEQLQTVQRTNLSLENNALANIDQRDMILRLEHLDAIAKEFSDLGLVANFPAQRFISAYSASLDRDKSTIQTVLKPYIEGMEARLNALYDLKNIIQSVLDTANSFLSDKYVRFNMNLGISIMSKWNEPIDPNFLSSGEKQLLLLLCNVVLARKRSSIFLIDEPELSLNIKWQRKLVDALLDCARGGNIQFIMASHSLELITQFRSSTIRLQGSES